MGRVNAESLRRLTECDLVRTSQEPDSDRAAGAVLRWGRSITLLEFDPQDSCKAVVLPPRFAATVGPAMASQHLVGADSMNMRSLVHRYSHGGAGFGALCALR